MYVAVETEDSVVMGGAVGVRSGRDRRLWW